MYSLCLLADPNVRSPKGEVFKISRGATFQDGRIKSVDRVIFRFIILV